MEEIVQTMEARYGRVDRVGVMDRGMALQGNTAFFRGEGRRVLHRGSGLGGFSRLRGRFAWRR